MAAAEGGENVYPNAIMSAWSARGLRTDDGEANGHSQAEKAFVQHGATLAKGGTGDMVSFIGFRSGTRSLPVVQATERKFQIVLDVPAAVGLRRCPRPLESS